MRTALAVIVGAALLLAPRNGTASEITLVTDVDQPGGFPRPEVRDRIGDGRFRLSRRPGEWATGISGSSIRLWDQRRD